MFKNYFKRTWIVIAVIVIAAVPMSYGVAVYGNSNWLVISEHGTKNGKHDSAARLDTTITGIPQGADPCNGTGGTGQI
ncbi:MAG TPA: hypothetical protein VEV62_16210, partial [Parafilimonas sp.]|nr:hypothetical protein [Parafilimonas sp.]